MPVNFPDGNDIPAVGSARPMGTLPYSDLAVFLDGDIHNDSPGNVLDLAFFEEHYSFEQYIEDTRDRVYLMRKIRMLEGKMRRAYALFADGAAVLNDYAETDET